MTRRSAQINVARGEIVDQQALLVAMKAGKLAGAILDVYDGEFAAPPPSVCKNSTQLGPSANNCMLGTGIVEIAKCADHSTRIWTNGP
eukprot:SAG31_NODE_4118_length_3565_cov_2.083670_4_plen_88_part_00